MMKLISVTLSVILISFLGLKGQYQWTAPENPVELGQVHWLRNYAEAIAQSKKSNLPILLLFQEVPGCANCTTYGNNVLSHPFMVEMIETHFVPLAIFNNKGGHDREVLKKFNEPTWNNPVVRIINSKGKDLVSRLSGDFSQKGLAAKIKTALSLSGQVEPTYFTIYQTELNGADHSEEAYLSMYCFWTGEKEIAKIDGVLSTEAGFMHGKEVVKVSYDATSTGLKEIVDQARTKKCADQVYASSNDISNVVDKKTGKYRVDREVKYYLHNSPYKVIPMTSLQSAKVNTAIGERQNPRGLLSPRQLSLMEKTKNLKNYINSDFADTWYDAIQDLQ